MQILAAEKAGSWSAALTLYEQALKNEGSMHSSRAGPAQDPLKPGSTGHQSMAGHIEGGLSAARRGHLNCLLQLGHLQALLVGVDGWMTRCPGKLLWLSPSAHPLHADGLCKQFGKRAIPSYLAGQIFRGNRLTTKPYADPSSFREFKPDLYTEENLFT